MDSLPTLSDDALRLVALSADHRPRDPRDHRRHLAALRPLCTWSEHRALDDRQSYGTRYNRVAAALGVDRGPSSSRHGRNLLYSKLEVFDLGGLCDRVIARTLEKLAGLPRLRLRGDPATSSTFTAPGWSARSSTRILASEESTSRWRSGPNVAVSGRLRSQGGRRGQGGSVAGGAQAIDVDGEETPDPWID